MQVGIQVERRLSEKAAIKEGVARNAPDINVHTGI